LRRRYGQRIFEAHVFALSQSPVHDSVNPVGGRLSLKKNQGSAACESKFYSSAPGKKKERKNCRVGTGLPKFSIDR
jgi:hypothetical protein